MVWLINICKFYHIRGRLQWHSRIIQYHLLRRRHHCSRMLWHCSRRQQCLQFLRKWWSYSIQQHSLRIWNKCLCWHQGLKVIVVVVVGQLYQPHLKDGGGGVEGGGCFKIWILRSYVEFIWTFLLAPQNQQDPLFIFYLINLTIIDIWYVMNIIDMRYNAFRVKNIKRWTLRKLYSVHDPKCESNIN